MKYINIYIFNNNINYHEAYVDFILLLLLLSNNIIL